MAKLQNLKAEYEREGFHMQRLYSRRKTDKDGKYYSTFGELRENVPAGRSTYENEIRPFFR